MHSRFSGSSFDLYVFLTVKNSYKYDAIRPDSPSSIMTISKMLLVFLLFLRVICGQQAILDPDSFVEHPFKAIAMASLAPFVSWHRVVYGLSNNRVPPVNNNRIALAEDGKRTQEPVIRASCSVPTHVSMFWLFAFLVFFTVQRGKVLIHLASKSVANRNICDSREISAKNGI